MEPLGDDGPFAWDDGSPYTLEEDVQPHAKIKDSTSFQLMKDGIIRQLDPDFASRIVVCQGDFLISNTQ